MSEYVANFIKFPTDRKMARFGIFTSSKAFEIQPEMGEWVNISHGPDGTWLVHINREGIETARYNSAFIAYICWETTPPEPS